MNTMYKRMHKGFVGWEDVQQMGGAGGEFTHHPGTKEHPPAQHLDREARGLVINSLVPTEAAVGDKCLQTQTLK